MLHTHRTPEHARDQLLRKATEQVACVSTRVSLYEEKGASLNHECPATEAPDRTSEQFCEQLTRFPACCPITEPTRQAPDPAWHPLTLHEQSAYRLKDLGAVGTANHEAKQAMDFLVSQTDPTPYVFAVRADLALHHITEPEASGDRLCGNFSFEKLHRKIHVPHDLE